MSIEEKLKNHNGSKRDLKWAEIHFKGLANTKNSLIIHQDVEMYLDALKKINDDKFTYFMSNIDRYKKVDEINRHLEIDENITKDQKERTKKEGFKSDLPEKTSITKVLGVLILIVIGLILTLVVHESYFVSDEEKYEREKSYQTSMLVNTEITLPCVGCGNGTPKIYLRSNGEGFFQLMEGGVPSCRSDMRWHYNHVTEKLTVSGIYNSNCTLKQFNKVYDKRKK
jgi:hypothetical protein